MLIFKAGVPYFRIHVCNRRWCHNNLFPGYDPILDPHVNPIWHPDDIEMHSETQSLGIHSLQDWQAKQSVDIKPNAAVCNISCQSTRVDFRSDT